MITSTSLPSAVSDPASLGLRGRGREWLQTQAGGRAAVSSHPTKARLLSALLILGRARGKRQSASAWLWISLVNTISEGTPRLQGAPEEPLLGGHAVSEANGSGFVAAPDHIGYDAV
jgi:hypothetical protein